jgi:phenylacetate-coenzyme A ligase PaaK-like adenylate-forming protein
MATNANGEQYTPGKCFECRKGEHEDYDDDVQHYDIIDPKTNKRINCGRLCSTHVDMFLMDGYILH